MSFVHPPLPPWLLRMPTHKNCCCRCPEYLYSFEFLSSSTEGVATAHRKLYIFVFVLTIFARF
ncbi:hypothetical protein M5D96_008670 [Drosophila gunungcola]|uniref:Uncharacterized protein n=1 Tax=Drosophila gunungcola TaxID=103775 RepID=A0A9Q0BNA4_9MUSC|nr:hypothetical protein M5D96_008670 [Drosophila gunungcola]